MTILLHRRAKAAGLHLLASCAVAGLVSLLVFHLWYPAPFAAIAGGTSLFLLLVSVDVVMGPALTAVAASPAKPLRELQRDLAVILLLQLGAFGYGLYTMAMARPVYLVFEVDRMRVVVAADVDPAGLADAPAHLRSLPWTGPGLIAAVKPTNPDELMRSVELGMSGIDLSMVPRNWRDYAGEAANVWRVARPVDKLLAKYPAMAPELEAMAVRSGQQVQALRFLPLVSRQAMWVSVVAEPGARIVGHLPVSGFF